MNVPTLCGGKYYILMGESARVKFVLANRFGSLNAPYVFRRLLKGLRSCGASACASVSIFPDTMHRYGYRITTKIRETIDVIGRQTGADYVKHTKEVRVRTFHFPPNVTTCYCTYVRVLIYAAPFKFS
jgi:hypothetical protein